MTSTSVTTQTVSAYRDEHNVFQQKPAHTIQVPISGYATIIVPDDLPISLQEALKNGIWGTKMIDLNFEVELPSKHNDTGKTKYQAFYWTHGGLSALDGRPTALHKDDQNALDADHQTGEDHVSDVLTAKQNPAKPADKAFTQDQSSCALDAAHQTGGDHAVDPSTHLAKPAGLASAESQSLCALADNVAQPSESTNASEVQISPRITSGQDKHVHKASQTPSSVVDVAHSGPDDPLTKQQQPDNRAENKSPSSSKAASPGTTADDGLSPNTKSSPNTILDTPHPGQSSPEAQAQAQSSSRKRPRSSEQQNIDPATPCPKRRCGPDFTAIPIEDDVPGPPQVWTPKIYRDAHTCISKWQASKKRKADCDESGDTVGAVGSTLDSQTPASKRQKHDESSPGREITPWPMQGTQYEFNLDYRIFKWDIHRTAVGQVTEVKLVSEPKLRQTIPNPVVNAHDAPSQQEKDPFFNTAFTFNDNKAFPLLPSCDGQFEAEAQSELDRYLGDGPIYWLNAAEEMQALISDYSLTQDIRPYVTSKSHFPPSYKTENMSDWSFREYLSGLGCFDDRVRSYGDWDGSEYADIANEILLEKIYVLREYYELHEQPRYDHKRVKDPVQGFWYDTSTEAGIRVRSKYIAEKARQLSVIEAAEEDEEL